MERQIVDSGKLVQIINIELKKYENYENCSVSGIIGSKLDEDGCNWSPPHIQCSGVPAEVCIGTANLVIAEMRNKYNISDVNL